MVNTIQQHKDSEGDIVYFCGMKLTLGFLLVFCIVALNHTKAQQMDVIKDTADYKLSEVDSAYYFSHGAEIFPQFIIDSSFTLSKNGIVHLPLLNGAYLEFGDTLNLERKGAIMVCNYEGENERIGCYLVGMQGGDTVNKTFLVERKTGKVDTIENEPSFSPSSLVYVSNFFDLGSQEAGIKVHNHQTGKTIRIILFNHLESGYRSSVPYYYRWIGDDQFLVHTLPQFAAKPNDRRMKYFLVEVKN